MWFQMEEEQKVENFRRDYDKEPIKNLEGFLLAQVHHYINIRD